MVEVPVCVIGCGPIGLTGALLLSRHGVPVLLVERRSELNTHPRSRFVDTNTMELLREFGLDERVSATGLDFEWTKYNRWSDNLAVEPYATIASPTFLKARGPHSPCVPAMTVQDEVEKALMSKVSEDPNIIVRFDTEAGEIGQSETGVQLTLRNTQTGDRDRVRADYVIGADGPGSATRAVIGAQLDANPRPTYMQDVIFHADLSAYVGDRKGSLLYTQPPEGVLIFQPLDGRRRWRCQVSIPSPELISEDATRARIRASLGTEDDVGLDITSMSLWQPTPGCVTTFSDRRIFLAGDAAHVAVPTGGLGNNSGFSGIRNLAWKLAYVVKGWAPPSILDTYEVEHRPVAMERIEYGVVTTDCMGKMMIGHRLGEDIAEHIQATHRYADYDHLLQGFELTSELIAPDDAPAPETVGSDDFSPLVRSGRRAPHVWLDDVEERSVLDWFGWSYVLLVGDACDSEAWRQAVAAHQPPVEVRQLPPGSGPYAEDEVVLVRPDGVIALRRIGTGAADVLELLRYVPAAAS